jgi:hypothetical protein
MDGIVAMEELSADTAPYCQVMVFWHVFELISYSQRNLNPSNTFVISGLRLKEIVATEAIAGVVLIAMTFDKTSDIS